MSSINEKLELFNEVILKDAASERNRILREIQADMEERIDQEKKKYQEQADALLRKELSASENEKNNIISNAIIESKQLLIRTREEILRTVSLDVKELLDRFVDGKDYPAYLSDQIRHSCRIAGEGELTVFLSKKDKERFAPMFEEIGRSISTHTIFDCMEEDIIGGCLVLNRSRNVVVNETLMEKLKTGMDSFFENCDLKID